MTYISSENIVTGMLPSIYFISRIVDGVKLFMRVDITYITHADIASLGNSVRSTLTR